jgi:hypothetical protein
MADSRTLLHIVSNCYTELRIWAREFSLQRQADWTHSLHLENRSCGDYEGVLSPSILLQLSQHLTLQVSVNLYWGAGNWMVDADMGQSDLRDEDSYQQLWQTSPVRCDSLDAALRALAQATGEAIRAAQKLPHERGIFPN